MRRVDRLFDIIQMLRTSRRPVPASALAARLEVAVRTIYRDIAVLQAGGVPIDGAAGLGYVLDDGFDLPPLMFTPDELRTMAVAMHLLRRTADRALQEAGERVCGKITAVLPRGLPGPAEQDSFYVSPYGARVAEAVRMSDVHAAIGARRKLRIEYIDRDQRPTCRTIWPLAIAYYVEATIIGAWCELRGDYRHFRTDRIAAVRALDSAYPSDDGRLLAGWHMLRVQSNQGPMRAAPVACG